MTDANHVITKPEELEALFGRPRQAQQTKAVATLDVHARRWIAASPFVVICSADAEGRMDLSPKGDPPGFVRIITSSRMAVPDRPGNKRFDTFLNVLENPRVGLIFLVPGRGETLRVEGRAHVSTDPNLLASMAVAGRDPALALVIDIDQIMFHCGKSMIRSKLWQPSDWPNIDGLASYAECLADQAEPDETVDEMETRFATWQQGHELY